MSDKYPSLSPYAYCAWNPVKLVDPDGMDTIVSIDINNGSISVEKSDKSVIGCRVDFTYNGELFDSYLCKGDVNSTSSDNSKFEWNSIFFSQYQDANNVYSILTGKNNNNLESGVEWNLYNYQALGFSELVTSQKNNEINLTGYNTSHVSSMRHYQPYALGNDYSYPSVEDFKHSRDLNVPCYLDYCNGNSYRYDNLIPNNVSLNSYIIKESVNRNIIHHVSSCR